MLPDTGPVPAAVVSGNASPPNPCQGTAATMCASSGPGLPFRACATPAPDLVCRHPCGVAGFVRLAGSRTSGAGATQLPWGLKSISKERSELTRWSCRCRPTTARPGWFGPS